MKRRGDRGIEFNEETGRLYIKNQEGTIENIKLIDYISKTGANGFVFKGENTLTGRKIALKIWTPRQGFDLPDLDRFNAEIKKNSRYISDKIVQIYTGGKINDYFYAEMEYVDGETLEEWLNKWSRSFIQRKKILDQMLEGIKVVHDGDDYHGDLHSKNVMVTEDLKVKILDLGTSIFSGKGKSHERDARLLFETGKSLIKTEMGEYNFIDSDLVRNPMDFPPEIVREFLDGVSTIIWSLKYELSSDNKLLFADMSVSFCKTPVFDLSRFVEYLNHEFKEKEVQSFLGSLKDLLVFTIASYNTKMDRNPSLNNLEDFISIDLITLYDIAKNLCLENHKLYLECFKSIKSELFK